MTLSRLAKGSWNCFRPILSRRFAPPGDILAAKTQTTMITHRVWVGIERGRFAGQQAISLALMGFVAAIVSVAVVGRFLVPERWEYSEIAANLLQGKGASYEYFGTQYFFWSFRL
jgi:hypothetical protein